jgi:hypothetical protein
MAIFEKEHYGKPISDKLSFVLVGNRHKDNRPDDEDIVDGLIKRDHILKVSNETGINYNTLWFCMCGKHNLTPRNGDAIMRLMQMAYENAIKRESFDRKAIRLLRKLIK